MKAIVQDTYGTRDVLEFREIDTPVPGDDEVLVRVRAAGVEQGVWHLMTGLPYLIRLAGYGIRAPKVRVRGREVAGQVAALGRNVTGFRAGDEVFGICEGSFAEYACASPHKLVLKPPNRTFEQAAAVPISAMTALQALRGRVRPGHRVLVIGAGGGVGTYAVQLAKASGARVTGLCSTAKLGLVRSIGADDVIDYTVADFANGRYDLIIDTAGNRTLSHLRRGLTPEGTLVIVGGTGGRWLGGTERVLRALLLNPFTRQKLLGLFVTEQLADLEALRQMLEDGVIVPVVDRTFSLGEAADAVTYVHKGHARGKAVVVI